MKEARATLGCCCSNVARKQLDAYIMDSPIVSQVLRRLLSHETCSKIRYRRSLTNRLLGQPLKHSRGVSVKKGPHDASSRESNWQQRTDIFPKDKSKEFERYPMITAEMLRTRRERPTRVKMLTRDFIEGTGFQISKLC